MRHLFYIISFLTSCFTGLKDANLEIIITLWVFPEILPFDDYGKNSFLDIKPDVLHKQILTIVYREHVRKDIVAAIGINQINQDCTILQNILSYLRELKLLIYVATGLALGS